MRNSGNRQKIPYIPKKNYKKFIEILDNKSFKQTEAVKNKTFPDDNYDFKKWLIFSQKLNQQYNERYLNSKSFVGYNCIQTDEEFEKSIDKKWRYDPNFSSSYSNDYLLRFSQLKPKKFIQISEEITDIQSILNIIDKYPISDDIEYNINIKNLHKIKYQLQKLNSMIGLSSIKSSIIDNILYFMQDLHKSNDGKNTLDFMHTVLYGPPGTGKTEVAILLGQIYSNLGILKKGTFRKVTRSDLIGGYLGQTALKTSTVIKDSLDGVLFIDEAYSLGNEEKKDIYAKECLDTLCEAASFYKDRLLIIIAGYKDELKTCFFSYNQGLESRFPWVYETDKYDSQQLSLIMKTKINNISWKLSPDINIEDYYKWFDKNYEYFPYFGRDIENLLTKIKIAHGRRVFSKPINEKKILNLDDFNNGLKQYLNNNNIKTNNRLNSKSLINHLYS